MQSISFSPLAAKWHNHMPTNDQLREIRYWELQRVFITIIKNFLTSNSGWNSLASSLKALAWDEVTRLWDWSFRMDRPSNLNYTTRERNKQFQSPLEIWVWYFTPEIHFLLCRTLFTLTVCPYLRLGFDVIPKLPKAIKTDEICILFNSPISQPQQRN